METVSKVSTTCDSCKSPISTLKPKKGEPPNDGIKATLMAGPLGETKDYHFCDEECLRVFLNARNKKNKSRGSVSSIFELDFKKTVQKS